jgi:hypothetical protein
MVLSLVIVAVAVTPSSAILAPYDGIGGNGGAAFRLDCGASALLVGIAGRSGAFVDQLAGLCVKIDPVSGTWVGGVYETARVGGNGGGPFSKVCPAGQALIGIEGTTDRFSGTLVVASLKIECTQLKIRTEYQPAMIKGSRRIDINGDPEPYQNKSLQDLCYEPLKRTGHYENQWVQVGVALEGRAGLFLDHVHILCGELAHDPRGYRIAFRTSTKSQVPEGTPLLISWRATGAAPELTPNLKYQWELVDWTHTRPGFIGSQPTTIQNPCSYAAQPCQSGLLSSESASQVTFHSLPPARYELRVTASTTGLSYAQSVDTLGFEVVPNRILSVTLNPSTIRTGGSSNATVTLEGPAPKRGIRVYLESSSPDTVPVPQSLVVPMGQPAATFPLRANANVLGDRVTITARLQRSMSGQLKDATTASSVSSAYLQSRGLEEGEAAPSTAESEAEEVPQVDLPPHAETAASGESSRSDGPITERGIGSLALRRSGTVAQSPTPYASSPAVTPAPPTAAIVPQVKPPAGAARELSVTKPSESKSVGAAVARPAPSSAEILTGPGNTKQAILTIQANVRTAPLAVPRRNLELGR